MNKLLILFIFLSFLFSCSEKSIENDIVTVPIEEDYSNIVDPKERWQAYNLRDYVLDESIACNCPPPAGAKAIIIDNHVIDVEFEFSGDDYPGRSRSEIKSQLMQFAMTIDEAFEFVESFADTQKIEIEYDSRFGFPSRIHIDGDTAIVDDEYSRRFYNLEKIVN